MEAIGLCRYCPLHANIATHTHFTDTQKYSIKTPYLFLMVAFEEDGTQSHSHIVSLTLLKICVSLCVLNLTGNIDFADISLWFPCGWMLYEIVCKAANMNLTVAEFFSKWHCIFPLSCLFKGCCAFRKIFQGWEINKNPRGFLVG